MNLEQAKSSVRWFVTAFGMFIAGWFASKGWFTIDQVMSVLSSETTISVLASLAMFFWGIATHTKTNAVAVVDDLAKQKDSPVKAVILEPTVAGRDLADSLPGNTTVIAGSNAALAQASRT